MTNCGTCNREFKVIGRNKTFCSRVCYRKRPTYANGGRKLPATCKRGHSYPENYWVYPDKKSGYCIKCRLGSYKRRRKKGIKDGTWYAYMREAQLKKHYGIDNATFENMLKSQKYKCVICHKKYNKKGKMFHVDHCHKTEKVRGILCTNCNTGIGMLKDNVEIMKRGISYLVKHNAS